MHNQIRPFKGLYHFSCVNEVLISDMILSFNNVKEAVDVNVDGFGVGVGDDVDDDVDDDEGDEGDEGKDNKDGNDDKNKE